MTVKRAIFFMLLTIPLVLPASIKMDTRAGQYQTVGHHAITGDEIWHFNGQLIEGNQSMLIVSTVTGLVALSHDTQVLWAWKDESLQTQFTYIQDERLFVFALPVSSNHHSESNLTLVTLNLVDGQEISRQPLLGKLDSYRFLTSPNPKYLQIQQQHNGIWFF